MVINYNIKMAEMTKVIVNLNKKFIIFTEDFIDENPDIFFNKSCNYCRNENTELFKCGNCKCIYYCSKKCQKEDWKFHKNNCGLFNVQFTYKTSKKGCMLISNGFHFSANIIKKYFNIKKIKYWEMKLNENHILIQKMDFETMETIKKNYKGIIEELKEPNSICLFERTNVFTSVYKMNKYDFIGYKK